MAEDTLGKALSTRDWMLDQVYGDGPAVIVADQPRVGADDPGEHPAPAVEDDNTQEKLDAAPERPDLDVRGQQPHALDGLSGASPAPSADPDINAAAKRAAVRLGAGVLGLAALIVAAFAVFGGARVPAAPPQHHAPNPGVAAAPTTTNLPTPQHDQAVAFVARTDSCTPNGAVNDQLAARSPQALTDASTDSAWVCGRGPQESLLDGQILHVQFTCDPSRPTSACSYMLDAVSVTPGWVAKTPGGKEEWLQHRVVTRLQFNFFNGNQLAADPYFLDTHSIHGPVQATLPTKVLASRVDVIILHTDRPPTAPLPTTTAAAPSPELPLPAPASPNSFPAAPADPTGALTSDPADATFAISQMQFFGHSPN